METKKNYQSDCLLCRLGQKEEEAEVVWENEEFIVIKDKYPRAPIHLLVFSKEHREKKETIAGQFPGFWDRLFAVCGKVIKETGLDQTGYKLVNNGAGYNHFEHEHLHILGGSKEEPRG